MDGQISGKETFSESLFTEGKRFVQLLDDIILRFDGVEKAGRSATSSVAFAEAEKQNAEAIRQSNTALSERERLEKRIATQTEKIRLANSDLGRQYATQRVELNRLNRENRTQAVIVNNNERAYTRLSRAYNEAKKDLKDLIVTTGQYTPAAREQAREVERLGEKIKVADNISGDFQRNVGNYPSALGPAINVVRQLIGVFGIVEGIRLGARLVADLSEIAREARGVEFAFQRLGDTATDAFERTRESTRGLISDLDLKTAIVQFDNFNLELDEINTLLEFAAVRSAQTGENFEFMLNSLVEGLARESLRRLDNLGVSMNDIKNLSDELGVSVNEAFTILAGQEVERAGNILDEAANGGQRFNASLNNIQVSAGQIINTIQGFSVINDILGAVGTTFELNARQIQENGISLDILTNAYRTYTFEGRLENQRLLDEIKNREEARRAIDAQIDAYIRLNGTLGPLREGQDDSFDFLTGPQQEAGLRTLESINEEIERQQGLLESTDVTDKKRLQTIADKINALNAERKAILDLLDTDTKATKTRKEFVREFALDTEAGLQGAIQYLEQQQTLLTIGSDEWQALGKQAENYRKLLKRLKEEATLSVEDIAFIDEDAAQDALDVENFLNTEGIAQGIDALAKRLGKSQEELTEEFEKYYEQDYENFLKYAKLKEAADKELEFVRQQGLVDSLGVSQDFAQAFFELESNRIDDQIEKQNEAFDAIINSKNSSDEQIRIAEEKRAQNEERLEKERERRQRRNFLIQQAFAVAQAILQGELAAVAALTPPPIGLGPIAGIPAAANARIQAALAVGTILAQAVPQFFKGKNYTDKYEGIASVNELPGQREVGISKDGKVELFPKGMHYRHVKKDDIIAPSVSAYRQKLNEPGSEIFKRVVGSKYQSDTKSRMQVVYVKGSDSQETSRLLKETNRLLKRNANRPVRVTSKVIIEKPSKFFAA